jgi:N-hydroxyarylamine O-acetyltransferase
VRRSQVGDVMVGNHLLLKVELAEGPWIADVGFGDGVIEPFPLREAAIDTDGFTSRLERIDDSWWRFHNHAFGGAPDFDFQETPADPALLAEKCLWLQAWPESLFRLNAVAQRRKPGEVLALRGRTLKVSRPDGARERLIGSAEEYVEVLARDFGLDLPQAAELWPRVLARHEELLGAATA